MNIATDIGIIASISGFVLTLIWIEFRHAQRRKSEAFARRAQQIQDLAQFGEAYFLMRSAEVHLTNLEDNPPRGIPESLSYRDEIRNAKEAIRKHRETRTKFYNAIMARTA